MKLTTQTYYLFAILIVFCLNVGGAFNSSFNISGNLIDDSIKVTKLSDLQEKIKLDHRPSENQIRIETDFQAADQLSAEIINMIGVSCHKTNFRVNTTIDYNLKPGIYFVVVYFKKERVFSSKILVSQ
jgi:hypothetical protein